MKKQENNVVTYSDDGANTGFSLIPYDGDLRLDRSYVKLETNKFQKEQVTALTQYIPSIFASGTLSKCYIAKFPDGVQHSLVKLKQGGYSSFYRDGGTQYAGTASLFEVKTQAAFLGVFTALSALTGQYYLHKINENLSEIKKSIDDILMFLYGDKKAELLAEVEFVKFAYENFSSISGNDAHRTATIGSLQAAKKIAMKDLEFYMQDLVAIVNGKDSTEVMTSKALKTKDCLDLSMQLYGMSSILEVYYSQNYDAEYVNYVKNDVSTYIRRCEKGILSNFSALIKHNADVRKGIPNIRPGKNDKAALEKKARSIVDELNGGEISSVQKMFSDAFATIGKEVEYAITSEGDVYLKAS